MPDEYIALTRLKPAATLQERWGKGEAGLGLIDSVGGASTPQG
jgi:hypothetical protein